MFEEVESGLTGPAGTDKQKRIEKNAKSEEKREIPRKLNG